MAYQYHSFDTRAYSFYLGKSYDYKTRKEVNPNLAKALLKNSSFQSLAGANDKVKYSILSQDLNLVRNALEDPRVNHDDMHSSPLQMACEYGSLDYVKLLVNHYGINISAHDNSGLCEASRSGYDDIVKYIISHPEFNPESCSGALISASDNLDVVQLLLSDPRFDPSLRNNQAIIDASCRGNGETVKLLLADPRVDPSDQDNRSIIM